MNYNNCRYTTSSCGNNKWVDTTAPRCKSEDKNGKCCKNIKVQVDQIETELERKQYGTDGDDKYNFAKTFVKRAVGTYVRSELDSNKTASTKYNTIYTSAENCNNTIIYSVSHTYNSYLYKSNIKEFDGSWIIYDHYDCENDNLFIESDNHTAQCPANGKISWMTLNNRLVKHSVGEYQKVLFHFRNFLK